MTFIFPTKDVAKLVELMDKVSKLDIDVNVLAQQASESMKS